MLTVKVGVGEFERDLIRTRTGEGCARRYDVAQSTISGSKIVTITRGRAEHERTPAMFAGAFASFRVNGVRLTIAAEQQDEDE